MHEVRESRPPLALREVMADLRQIHREEWLYIPRDTTEITASLLCRFVTCDDYLDDELDHYCEIKKQKSFFFVDQLEDIESNLRAQKPRFTEQELMIAIDHYWRHDSFVAMGY